jgi:hypothetical protein
LILPFLAAEASDHAFGLMLDDHAIEQGFDNSPVFIG